MGENQPVKLIFEITDENLIFKALKDNLELALEKWFTPELKWAPYDEDRVLILNQAVEGGLAELSGNSIKIDYINLFEMEYDLTNLKIADYYPFGLEIESHGGFADATFGYNYQFIDGNQRPFVGIKRTGAILLYGPKRWLVPKDLYLLINSIEEQNQNSNAELADRMISFSKIKGLSEAVGAKLDKFLQSQNIISPAKVKIRLCQGDNGELRVEPDFSEIAASGKIAQEVNNSPIVKDFYTYEADGKKVKLALTPLLKSGIEEIKQINQLPNPEKKTFIENPYAYINSPVIDLDDFGERVKEIGIYQYRLYPFIVREGTSWLPEIQLEEVGTNKTVIQKVNKEMAEKLLAEFNEAKKDGKSHFSFEGKEILVNGETEKQLNDLYKLTLNKEDSVLGRNILKIFENTEFADYVPLSAVNQEVKEFSLSTMELPVTLKNFTVLTHQKEGIAWLQSLHSQRINTGALLADDMGLGKTLQLWCFIEYLRLKRKIQGPILIVAPIGLLEQWKSEYQKFFSGDDSIKNHSFLMLHGAEIARLKLNKTGNEISTSPSKKLDVSKILKYQIIMTSYETLRDYQFSLASIDWEVVIADEAQKVKNPSSMMTNAIKAVKARFRIASTGTPIENSLADLWCIADFIYPGKLGCLKDFLAKYNPKSESEYETLSQKIKACLEPHLLRRKKQEILKDLPIKKEQIINLTLTKPQEEEYLSLVKAYKRNKSPQAMMNILQKLRRISCLSSNYMDDDLEKYSCKIVWLLKILSQIQKTEEKAIIFVEFKDVQRLLARVLKHHFGINCSIINGDISPYRTAGTESRLDLINKFERCQGFNIIILSPLATGMGLNIIGANHVIHFSRHWNPAKEDQATDRAYRIGQKKTVYVYYPIAKGSNFVSFDEKLDELLKKKKHLSENALFPTIYKYEIKPDELQNVLEIETDATEAPIKIEDIDKFSIAEFQALILNIYRDQGFQVNLINSPQNYGFTITAQKHEEDSCLAIRAQNTMQTIEESLISEIMSGIHYYEQTLHKKIMPIIISNALFSSSCQKLAQNNKVELIDRDKLIKLLKETAIYKSEILSSMSDQFGNI